MCKEYIRFLQEYQHSVALYSSALATLDEARATVLLDQYHQMTLYVDELRLKSEMARMELEKHVREHGCVPFMMVAET
jgi:hypothetical protein